MNSIDHIFNNCKKALEILIPIILNSHFLFNAIELKCHTEGMNELWSWYYANKKKSLLNKEEVMDFLELSKVYNEERLNNLFNQIYEENERLNYFYMGYFSNQTMHQLINDIKEAINNLEIV